MDPNACLQRIHDPERIDADCRNAMADLANWLHNGGFAPTWSDFPRGTKRFRRVHGTWKGMPGTFTEGK